MFDFPSFVELFCGFDTSREEEIFLSLYTWSCPKEEAYFIFSHLFYISVDSVMRLPGDNSPWCHEDNTESCDDDKEFTHFYYKVINFPSISVRFLSSYPPCARVLSERIIRFGIPQRSASPAFCPKPDVRSSTSTVAHSDSSCFARSRASARWSPMTIITCEYGATLSGQISHLSSANFSAITPIRREIPIP